MERNMIKLHLGCGNRLLPDYTNIDFFAPQNLDSNSPEYLKHDIRTGLPYDDDSVDEILAIHVVEHFTRNEWESISKDWARVLKERGKMTLICPDLGYAARMYLQEPGNDFWIKTIYGIQDHDGEFHKNGFTVDTLAESFPSLASKVIQRDGIELKMEFIK